LEEIWNQSHTNSDGDLESQQRTEKPRVRVVIHGIQNSAQAQELYNILESCRNTSLDVVAISTPELLREVSKNQWHILDYIYTLSVSETGIIYSGYAQTLPRFNQVINFTPSIVKGCCPDVFFRMCFALYWKAYIDPLTKLPRGEQFTVYCTSSDICQAVGRAF
jgi:hypothetical protein